MTVSSSTVVRGAYLIGVSTVLTVGLAVCQITIPFSGTGGWAIYCNALTGVAIAILLSRVENDVIQVGVSLGVISEQVLVVSCNVMNPIAIRISSTLVKTTIVMSRRLLAILSEVLCSYFLPSLSMSVEIY